MRLKRTKRKSMNARPKKDGVLGVGKVHSFVILDRYFGNVSTFHSAFHLRNALLFRSAGKYSAII